MALDVGIEREMKEPEVAWVVNKDPCCHVVTIFPDQKRVLEE